MTTTSDDLARRAYWAEQMQLGYELVQKVLAFEVRECGEGFASLRDAAAEAGIEMLFSDSKIAGELDRVFFMRESLVKHVMAVGRAMNERGWILKIDNQGDAMGHILSGQPAPARFGPVYWDPQTNRVTPCDDPLRPLNPLDVIEKEIAAALRRAENKRM